MQPRKLPHVLLVLSFLLTPGFGLHAESIVWTNTAGDWHRGENWNLLRPPAIGDDVVIADGADILLTNATPLLQSFTQTGGRLTFSNWTTRLQAVTVRLDAGTFTHTGPAGVGEMSNRVWITCTDFTLGTNASISVDARGYKAAQGPGAGGSSSGGGGGGHGGIGGLPYGKSPLAPGAANGDARFPGSPGSGGGLAVGGAGGGVVRIDCTGQATLFGTIQAAGGKAGQD